MSQHLGKFPYFQREYSSGTQKLVTMPLTDSIYLKMLQLLRLKLARINKQGGAGGWENFSKISKRGARLLGTKE